MNLPWSKSANDDGAFKSDEELRELYVGAGLDPDNEVIAYCRIGERSSHSWFVLRELLGHASAKNDDGSYLQWASLQEMPIHNPQTAA